MDDILGIMDKYDRDKKNIKHELYKMCWYMRGSVSVDEAYTMSIEDREIIGKIIQENLETTKNTNLPFY